MQKIYALILLCMVLFSFVSLQDNTTTNVATIAEATEVAEMAESINFTEPIETIELVAPTEATEQVEIEITEIVAPTEATEKTGAVNPKKTAEHTEPVFEPPVSIAPDNGDEDEWTPPQL